MQLVKLTVYKRNAAILTDEERIFDIDDIISPIRVNDDSKSCFALRPKTPSSNVPVAVVPVDYQVTEDLDEIQALDIKLLKLTVIRRNSTTIDSEEMVFNISKSVEGFVTTDAGTMFLYSEDGSPSPVEYEVTESLDDIIDAIDADPGAGTVTGVTVEDTDIEDIITAEVTDPNTTPEITFTLVDQVKNTVLAGPETGGDDKPTFRALIGDDLPLTIVNDPGNFVTFDPDNAMKVTIGGTDYYLPILIYP